MIQRHAYGQQCWWCGDAADSQEHRYRKTDIARLFGDGPYKGTDALLRVVGEKEKRLVQGPKSKELVFKANLCQKCNNERSQPFDRAYDQFIGHIEDNTASILAVKQIQFSIIFGSGWHADRENVIRYYVKHICCRLAEAGVLVDPRVIKYLDGNSSLCCIEIEFQIREDIVAMETKLRADDLTGGAVWIGDGMADRHPSNNTFSRFYSHVGYRWLRASYEYNDTYTSDFNVNVGDTLVLATGYEIDPATFHSDSEKS